jgi:hypothetical protein
MKPRRLAAIGFGVIACAVPAVMALGGTHDRQEPTGLVREVRQATHAFQDVNAAMAAGYSSAGSCVSGPEVGAMGVHFANGSLVGDGELDAAQPEILVYEQRNGRLRLLAVEYVVLAGQWDAKQIGPPVLDGQHFHYVGAPNRYGLPAFYELHVWAWKNNPNGMFVDWNPTVSCEEFSAGSAVHSGAMHGSH